MKIFILFLLALSSVVFSADYGGAVKYPDTNCTSGRLTLYIDGVAQPAQYTQLHTVIPAAIKISQKLPGSSVVIKTADITCTTVWRTVIVSSNSSSASSALRSSSSSVLSSAESSVASSFAVVTVAWEPPTQRENGALLPASEIGGYEIRFLANGAIKTVIIPAAATTAVVSGYPKNNTMQIAVYDKQNLYSEFVEVEE